MMIGRLLSTPSARYLKSRNLKVNSFGGAERFNQRVEAWVLGGGLGATRAWMSPFPKKTTWWPK